jgi:hypothetical protein
MLTSTLASGRTHGDLQSCARYLIPEVVAGVTGASRVKDSARLADLVRHASKFRDPQVFDAAIHIAEDKTATPEARVVGLLVGYSLIEPSFWPSPTQDLEQYFSGDTAVPEPCVLWSAWLAPPYWIDNGLPPDHLARLLEVTTHLSADQQTPVLVRRIAGCGPLTLQLLLKSRRP